MTASAIYEGTLRHRRFVPRSHEFSYRQSMLYLDVAELPELFRDVPLWSAERPALARWHRDDYLGPQEQDLGECVRARVAEELGRAPRGPVRMLTQCRFAGLCFNPITVYYCFDHEHGSERLDAIVAQVTNTPWGERHRSVIDCTDQPARQQTRFAKAYHVSPFNPLDMTYHWYSKRPGERLLVHLENHAGGHRHMDATLSLQRRPISRSALLALLWRRPSYAAQTVTRIYWQALQLWLKRSPVYPHPPGGKRLATEKH